MKPTDGAGELQRLITKGILSSWLQLSLCVGVQYDEKLCNLLDTYDKLFLVHADNVGSRQFMDIRRVSQLTPCSRTVQSSACPQT